MDQIGSFDKMGGNMSRFLALLVTVFALSLAACETPSEQSPSDQKNQGKSSVDLALPQ
jgi:hypothetical protein